MPKVLTYGGDVQIGAYKFPDRKRICLCVTKGNETTIYGTFTNESAADEFMNELGEFLGVEKEEE